LKKHVKLLSRDATTICLSHMRTERAHRKLEIRTGW
jgi:hypothetical protein